jgi:2Fe-2S ferredoxin
MLTCLSPLKMGEAEQFIRPSEVPRVTYIGPDGRRDTVRVAVGQTLLDGALDNNVPGIIGQCGGGCTCVTCHCYVDPPWFEQLPEPHPDEAELLPFAECVARDSRLSCQIRMTEALDGITVRLPVRQLPERQEDV